MGRKSIEENCLLCGGFLSHELTIQQVLSFQAISFNCICFKCEKKFELKEDSQEDCVACGRTLDPNSSNIYNQAYIKKQDGKSVHYCLDCWRWLEQYPAYYLKHQSIYQYNVSFREFLYQYKYQGDYRLSQIVVKELKRAYIEYKDYQWLVLPSSAQAMKERQFHATASLLAEASIPFYCPFAYQGDGIRQASKNRKERLLLEQSYNILEDSKDFLMEKDKLLLFDDIYTTGATLLKAKECLFQFFINQGVSVPNIISLSLARDNLQDF